MVLGLQVQMMTHPRSGGILSFQVLSINQSIHPSIHPSYLQVVVPYRTVVRVPCMRAA